MITAITPTGGRSKALALTDLYMQRQTCQEFRWVVLDDCDPASPRPKRADKVIRPSWRWAGENTQHRCMLELLKEPGPVVICEDDDWLHPRWIEHVTRWLESDELVGERFTHYYNVANRTWKRNRNDRHASLCATACRDGAKAELIRVCESGARMIDHELWRRYPGKLYDSDNVIGIKGLPGRAGIGIGHRMNGTPDPELRKLRALIGDDAGLYENCYNGRA